MLALINNEHFALSQSKGGDQVFYPTEHASAATLEQMKTPSGISKKEVKERFAAAGIDVSGIRKDG